jgi:hypothetical protein
MAQNVSSARRSMSGDAGEYHGLPSDLSARPRVGRGADMVAVVRWIEGSAMDGFVKRLIAATEAM